MALPKGAGNLTGEKSLNTGLKPSCKKTFKRFADMPRQIQISGLNGKPLKIVCTAHKWRLIPMLTGFNAQLSDFFPQCGVTVTEAST